MKLKLPPLQQGTSSCDAADSLILQVKAGSRAFWEKVEPVAVPDGEVVPALGAVRTVQADPMMVYQFRALARNSAGISAPGDATPPTMVNRFYAALLEPPKPTATSSASYTVSWGATLGACQPDVRWDLLFSRVADEEWHSAAENIATESVELPELRCADGCVFKARARGVEGFSGYSKNSAPLSTKPLPRLRAGAIRLEVRLEATSSTSRGGADDPSQRTDGAIARGLSLLAGVPDAAVSIAERRCALEGSVCYFVFDLAPPPGEATAVARSVAAKLQDRTTDALRDADLQYGLRQISQDSDTTTRIDPPVSALDTVRSAANDVAKLAASPKAARSVGMGMVVALSAALCCCCCCCCFYCLRGRRHKHSRVSIDEDDDEAWLDDDANNERDDVHPLGRAGPLAREDEWLDDVYGRQGGSRSRESKQWRAEPQMSEASQPAVASPWPVDAPSDVSFQI